LVKECFHTTLEEEPQVARISVGFLQLLHAEVPEHHLAGKVMANEKGK